MGSLLMLDFLFIFIVGGKCVLLLFFLSPYLIYISFHLTSNIFLFLLRVGTYLSFRRRSLYILV